MSADISGLKNLSFCVLCTHIVASVGYGHNVPDETQGRIFYILTTNPAYDHSLGDKVNLPSGDMSYAIPLGSIARSVMVAGELFADTGITLTETVNNFKEFIEDFSEQNHLYFYAFWYNINDDKYYNMTRVSGTDVPEFKCFANQYTVNPDNPSTHKFSVRLVEIKIGNTEA